MLTHHDGKMSVSSRWKDEKVMCNISILTHHDGKMSVSSRWKDEKLTPLLHLLEKFSLTILTMERGIKKYAHSSRWKDEKVILQAYSLITMER